MDITTDIQPMTTFRNNSAAVLRHLRETKRAVVLTVNGKAAAVLQDAEAYQRLMDLAALASVSEALRQADEAIARGEARPAAEVFAAFRASRGIPG